MGSENVGMSNRKPGEIPGGRKPMVSLAMAISQGLGGPKVNPKGVAEGQPVNIPAPAYLFLWGALGRRPSELLDSRRLFQGDKPWDWREPGFRGTWSKIQPGKAPKSIRYAARTANRHRWAGVSAPRPTGESPQRNSANKRP